MRGRKRVRLFTKVLAWMLTLVVLCTSVPMDGIRAYAVEDLTEESIQTIADDSVDQELKTIENDTEEALSIELNQGFGEEQDKSDIESSEFEIIEGSEMNADILEEETVQEERVEATFAGTQVTRIEWFERLINYFDLSVDVDNYPDNYYSDISSSYEKYNIVMTATEYGLVDVYPGEEFLPNGSITREDAAHTINMCMGYLLENQNYTYSDVNDCLYKNDIQIALDHQWFSLVNGAFLPTQAVTVDEVETIYNSLEQILEDEEITGANTYKYKDGVKVLPEDTEIITEDENVLRIVDCPVTLHTGDIFGLVYNSMPLAWTAGSIEQDGNDVIVTTSGLDFDSAFDSINVVNTNVIDIQSIEPVSETASLFYVVGGSEEENYSDGEMFEDYEVAIQEAGEEGIEAITIIDSLKPSNASIEVNGIEVEYKITISGFDYDWGANENNVYLNTNLKIKTSYKVEGDLNKLLNKEIELAKIPICPGLFYVPSAGFELKGSMQSDTYYTVNSKLSWSKKNGVRFNAGCKKDGTSFTGEIEGKFGFKVSVKADLLVMSASVYYGLGMKAKLSVTSYADSNLPAKCVNLSAYVFAEIGYKIKVGVDAGIFDVTIFEHKDSLNLFDAANSPVKIAVHIEDGVQISNCTCADRFKNNMGESPGYSCTAVEKKPQKTNSYFSPFNTPYYYNGYSSSVGTGDDKIVLFTYTYNTNTGYATITGYSGTAKNVFIPESIDGHRVVAIANNTFKGKSGIISVSIPDSVATIGNNAFQNCSKLADVRLSKGLTKIGYGAFQGCTSLESITIPKSLNEGDRSSDNYGIFKDSGLKHVSFEEGTEEISQELFALCNSLESIEIPSTVTRIEQYAFYKCIKLKAITIPNAVTTIGNNAFQGCTSLTEVILGTSVNTIGSQAFDGCIELETIEIPDSVITIGNGAFFGCNKLYDVKLSKGLTDIGYGTFMNCISLESITIPKSLNKGSLLWDFSNNVYKQGIFQNSGLKNVSFEEGTVEISEYIFAFCDSLESIEIPSTVTRIEQYAFYKCTNLKSVTLFNGIKQIGNRAFYGCSSLTEIILPNTVNSIGTYVFNGCNKLAKVVWSEDVIVIPEYTFYGCTSLAEINMPEKLTTVNNYAFYNTSSLKNITLPDSCHTINQYAFAKSGITSLSTHASTVGNYAFSNCNDLETVDLTGTWKSLGTNVFQGCDNLANINIKYGVNIPKFAFDGCGSLVDILIPYKTQSIAENAFTNCTSLRTITIPKTVSSINTSAFSDYDLTIKGVAGTRAESFANSKGFTFVPLNIPITSVKLTSKEYSIVQGGTITYNPDVTPANFTGDLVWISSDPSVATVTEVDTYNSDGSISSYGGTIRGVKIGSTTITVAAMDEYGEPSETIRYSFKLNVTKAVSSISLSPYSSFSMEGGDTRQITATVYPADASNKELLWSSTEPTVASVDQTGLVTAYSKGTTQIAATATDGSGKYTTITVTVTSDYVECDSVDELESAHNYENNTNKLWKYTLENAESLDVTFTEETAMYRGDTITIMQADKTVVGTYTARELQGKTITVPGDTVYIRLVSDGSNTQWGFKVNSIVPRGEIKEKNLSDITLEKESLILKVEDSEDLTVLFNPVDHTDKIELVWSSSDDSIASVVDGHVTAHKKGEAIITVSVKDRKDIASVQCRVKVVEDLQGISLQTDKSRVLSGYKGILSIITEPEDAELPGDITWVSDKPNVIEVQPIVGTARANYVAKENGSATITVTCGTQSASVTIQVDNSIQLNYQGGKGDKEYLSVVFGEPIRELNSVNPKFDGKVFMGWYSKPNGEGILVTIDTIISDYVFATKQDKTKDYTLYAYWIPEEDANTVGEGLRIEGLGEQMYTGSAIKPIIKLYDGSNLLLEGRDYSLTYKNNTNAWVSGYDSKKQPKIVVKGLNNYTKNLELTFNILPKDIADADVTIDDLSVAYNNGNDLYSKLAPVIYYKGKALKKNTDFTIASGVYKDAGNYKVTISGKGNYTGSQVMNLAIKKDSKALISKASISLSQSLKNRNYDINNPNKEQVAETGDITVKLSGKTLTEGIDYEVQYQDNVFPGKATIIIVGKGAYAGGSKRANFTIKGIKLAGDVQYNNAALKNVEYTGENIILPAESIKVVTKDNKVITSADFDVRFENNTKPGNAKLILTGKNLYKGSTLTKTFKIDKYVLKGADVIVDSEVPFVKGGAVNPGITVKFKERVLIENLDYTVKYSNNKAVTADASAVATIQGKGIFAGKVPKSFKINKQDIANLCMVVPAINPGVDISKVKVGVVDIDGKLLSAGKDFDVTSIAFYSDEACTEDSKLTADDIKAMNEGDTIYIKVDAVEGSNYEGTITGSAVIGQSDLSKAKITVKPGKSYSYLAGSPLVFNSDILEIKVGDKTLTEGEDFVIVGSSYSKNRTKGTATFMIRGVNNYGGYKQLKFTIKPQSIFKKIFNV